MVKKKTNSKKTTKAKKVSKRVNKIKDGIKSGEIKPSTKEEIIKKGKILFPHLHSNPMLDRENPFIPEIQVVVDTIFDDGYHFKTIKEYGSDKESMYIYIDPSLNIPESGTYKRGEAELKMIIERRYRKILEDMIKLADERILLAIKEECDVEGGKIDEEREGKEESSLQGLKAELIEKRYNIGISTQEVNKGMDIIRRTTFVKRESMNPGTHIPVQNGLLSLSTGELEPFTPDLFYTWKVQGIYDRNIRTLNDVPKFRDFLFDVFYPAEIPQVLQYLGYCLFPTFPRQKILCIFGEPRRGKGTLANIVEKMIPDGHGRISLMKMLIPDNRFALQNVENKNVLIDSEIKRDYRYKPDFSTVNSLTGGDTLAFEKKFKDEVNLISKAKVILIGNLPLFYVDNYAFLSRLLIVLTKKKTQGWKEIPNLANIIWESEGSKIVSVLLNLLQYLVRNDFRFAFEQSNEEYIGFWEKLCDSVGPFIDNYLTPSNNYVEVEKAYELYKADVESNGIPAESRHEFVRIVGKKYARTKVRNGKELVIVFDKCSISLPVETNEARIDNDDLGL